MTEPFGAYRLERLLGRGGMAEAFMAFHADDPVHPLVLKRIRPELADSDEYYRRFVLEAQVASRLEHPNLVRFREFGRVGRCHYIVMHMVQGWSLHRLLDPVFKDGSAPPLDAAVIIGAGILGGLAAMHQVQDQEGHPRPMLHRDVTPSNVILSQDGRPVIIDFGIAKDIMGPAITLPGRVIGTARYMSPEHRKAEYIDTRADVFSVSVILFELLVGRHPWGALSTMKELLRTTFDPPELDRKTRKRVPSELLQVVMKGLSCAPADRYPDAAEMSAALLACSASPGLLEHGREVVIRWAKSLGLDLDEALGAPVLDVPDRGGENEVVWTSAGSLSTIDLKEELPAAPSEPLTVPPLPPRRDAVLPPASMHDELSPEMVAALRRFSWSPGLFGLVIGGLIVLAAIAVYLVSG